MSYDSCKDGLGCIATAMGTERQEVKNKIQRIRDARGNLAILETVHADTIAELNAYSGSEACWLNAKSELSVMAVDYGKIIAELDTIIPSLENTVEF